MEGYRYNAWNRLTKTIKAYRDDQGDLQLGSTVQQNSYDGQTRRIAQQVLNSANLDSTYHYYYNVDWQLLETRNGSNLVLKQHVWGQEYTDELCQIAINDDPTDTNEDDCETVYFATYNANYNVTAIVDSSGDLVERYEYTPYGSRTVFRSAGSGDTTLMAAHYLSAPVTISGTDQPYSINDIGHQGLLHDPATGANGALIYNRRRILHTVLERFNQQDPMGQNEPGGGYHDGMNLYQYVKGNPLLHTDLSGMYTQGDCYSDCDKHRDAALAKGIPSGVANNTYAACIKCCGANPSPSCAGIVQIRNIKPLQPVPPTCPSLWSIIVKWIFG